MTNKKEDKNRVYWCIGKNMTKREANTAGLALLFGFVGAFVTVLIPIEKSKVVDYGIISLLGLAGYLIGRRYFK